MKPSTPNTECQPSALRQKLCHLFVRLLAGASRRLWKRLPTSLLSTWPFRACGRVIHKAISRRDRLASGYCACSFTLFLRNVPLLEVLRDLAAQKPVGSNLQVASIGCSTGAEIYSLLFFVRSHRPDLRIAACGLDISHAAIAKADAGVFSRSDEELSWLSETEVASLFDEEGGVLKVKPFLRQCVRWLVADAMDPVLSQILEPQDFLLANNFLGPLQDKEAEKCLCNLALLVKPGGYLIVFGLDLDFRTRWMKNQGYIPVPSRIEEVHYGDRAMLDWPWTRWGLEPLDKKRTDWQTRYAVVFQILPRE